MDEIEVFLAKKNSVELNLSETDEITADLSSDEISADLQKEETNVDVAFEQQIRLVMPKYHNEILGLDYENSGHKGFASTKQLETVKKTPATANSLGMVKVGENLDITDDGTLSVTTTDEAEGDNTKPITSKAVHTIVGNIDVLLSII